VVDWQNIRWKPRLCKLLNTRWLHSHLIKMLVVVIVENQPITDCHIRLPVPDSKKETCRSRRFIPSSLPNPQKQYIRTHRRCRYMREVISSLVNIDVHVVPLYRCLQGIYDGSPSGHIWYEPINPLIEEFLTLTLGRIP
jgi:hypothetical protein